MSKGRRKHSPALKVKVVLQAVKGEETDPDDAAMAVVRIRDSKHCLRCGAGYSARISWPDGRGATGHHQQHPVAPPARSPVECPDTA